MCGIVGIIAKSKTGFYSKDIQILQQMLFAGQLRGSHGTGIFLNNKKGRVRVVKGAMPGSDFINTNLFDIAMKDTMAEATFCIGHNRFATKGGLNFKSTHPFTEGDITLIHNGTLTTHLELANVEVDSHAICHSINNIGTEETIKKLNGAYALVWHDKRNNSLNLVRNKERPLHIFEVQGAFIICSERDMGLWIINRNNISIIKDYALTIDMLMSINLETMEITHKEVETYKPWTSAYSSYSKNGAKQVWNTLQGKYVPEDDYDIKEVISFLPKPKVTPEVPATMKHKMVKHGEPLNGFLKGDLISFFPLHHKNTGNANYIEGWYEVNDKDSEDIEVRFYNQDLKLLNFLAGRTNLVAKIIAIAVYAGKRLG